MRSIRRSLLGYLLLLLAVSLGAVGVLVDRFANAAVREREESETNRISEAYNVREREVRKKFDDEILVETKSLAMAAHYKTAELLGQNVESRRPPGGTGGGPPWSGGFPRWPEPQPPLKAPDEEAKEYRLRSGLAGIVAPPGEWHGVLSRFAFEPRFETRPDPRADSRAEWRRNIPFPGWTEYDAPRIPPRLGESLRKAFDDEQTNYFQFTFGATYPGIQPNHRVYTSTHSHRLGSELKFDQAWIVPNQEFEPRFDDVEVPGQGKFRQAVTGSGVGGRPIFFFVVVTSPPPPARQVLFFTLPVPTAAPARYAFFQPPRVVDIFLRVFVHHARPYSELDARLAVEQQGRDNQVAQVRKETREELAQLRSRLILICSGTFIALVLGGWLIVARGLSPLRKLSDAVSQVSEKDFRLPVVPAELGRELAPIHARITQTLTLLQRAFAREKQAVADISHELRTPIASLLATIDVSLRKPRTPDQYRATLEECRLISKQLGQLVERIMTLASLDAGNDHLAVSRTDVPELLAGCAAVIRPLAAANGLSVSVRHDDELALDTDAGKLREVLMNLLHNAVEYNKSGGTIELAARREAGWAVFEVRDTGIGMSPEVKEKIFERFYRADASRTATGVHAGLGLAIVKEYVERLHGSIAVESEVGAGTTFRVTLPLVLTTSEPTSPPSPPPSAPPDRAARDAIAASS